MLGGLYKEKRDGRLTIARIERDLREKKNRASCTRVSWTDINSTDICLIYVVLMSSVFKFSQFSTEKKYKYIKNEDTSLEGKNDESMLNFIWCYLILKYIMKYFIVIFRAIPVLHFCGQLVLGNSKRFWNIWNPE